MALIGSGRRLLHHSPYIPANITGGRVISELSRAESQTFVRMKECTHKCTHNRTRFYSSLSFEEMCLRKMEMCWLNFCTSVDGNLSHLVKGKPLCGDSCWYYLSTLFIVCKNTKKKKIGWLYCWKSLQKRFKTILIDWEKIWALHHRTSCDSQLKYLCCSSSLLAEWYRMAYLVMYIIGLIWMTMCPHGT